jgi:Fe-S cluster biosynthesis and repair protein YggX
VNVDGAIGASFGLDAKFNVRKKELDVPKTSLRFALADLLIGIDAKIICDAEGLDPRIGQLYPGEIGLPVAAELIVEQRAWRVEMRVPTMSERSASIMNATHWGHLTKRKFMYVCRESRSRGNVLIRLAGQRQRTAPCLRTAHSLLRSC